MDDPVGADSSEADRPRINPLKLENERLSRKLQAHQAELDSLRSEAGRLRGGVLWWIGQTLRHVEQSARWAIRRALRRAREAAPSRRRPDSDEEILERSGLFDRAWYLKSYPAVERSGADPVRHYLRRGAAEHLDPNPHFETAWYATAHGLLDRKVNPLLHYIREGIADGSRPSPYFDARIYRETHHLETAEDPLRHVLSKANEGFPSYPILDKSRQTILVVSHDTSRTGSPAVALSLIRELRLTGRYTVVALVIDGGELLEQFEAAADYLVGPFHLRLKKDYDLTRVTAFLRTLQPRPSFALVNSVESRQLLEPLARAGIPSVSLIHEFVSTYASSAWLPQLPLWSTEFVFPARIVEDDARRALPALKRRQTFVAPQGPSEIPASAEDDAAMRRAKTLLDRSAQQAIVLGAGYIHFRKGVDLFLATAAHWKTLPPSRKTRFVWLGDGLESKLPVDYPSFIADQFERSKLGDTAAFVPAVPALDEIYPLVDVFFMSSRLDPLPNVALDAMRAGVPVVCFDDTTGFSEILLGHPVTAQCVVPYLDVQAAAAVIARLVDDADFHRETSKIVVELAARHFDNHKYIASLERIGARAVERTQKLAHDREIIAADEAFDATFYRPPGNLSDRESSIFQFTQEWFGGMPGRKPCPGFHPGIYAERVGLDDRTNPLADYISKGRPPGPWEREIIRPSKQPLPPGAAGPVALHVHAYYPDLVADILKAASGNRTRCDLFLTTDTTEKAEELEALSRTYPAGQVQIHLFPNKGRDLLPFWHLKQDFSAYEIVGHVHTKKSVDVSDEAIIENWRTFLLANLLGRSGETMIDAVAQAFESRPSLGLVFPDDPHIVGWSDNRTFAVDLSERIGLPAHLYDAIDFPVGSMFWARTKALKSLFACDLDRILPAEPVPYDGSSLHALERLIPIIAEEAGYDYAMTHVPGLTR